MKQFIPFDEASRMSREKHPENKDVLPQKVDKIADDLKINQNLLYAVIFILLGTFLFLAIDAWKYHAESYNQFTDKLNSLEEKNYNLKVSILQDKIDNLDHEIQELKARENNGVTKNHPSSGN